MALNNSKTVVVGLSGGVDSAVATLLLKAQGWNVIGLFMKNWEDDDSDEYCSSRQDLIDVMSIADTIGISSGYLSTLFKSETGTGFNDYLNQVRISVSLKMLKDGNDDFRMIAANSGFQDYSYFFHVFKRKTGKTPSEYLAGMRSQV